MDLGHSVVEDFVFVFLAFFKNLSFQCRVQCLKERRTWKINGTYWSWICLGTRIMNSVRDNRVLSHEEEERYLPRNLPDMIKKWSVSCWVTSNSLQPSGLCKPARLLCPWNCPGKDLEWATRGSSQPRGWTQVSCIAGRFFTIWATWEAWSRSCHSVTQSCLTLRPHGLQHARLPCPLASPRTCSNSRASCCWCHPTISSSASNLLLSVFASIRVFSNELFASGGQRIGASVLVLLMNIQDWFPLGLTSLILQSKVLGNAKKREM